MRQTFRSLAGAVVLSAASALVVHAQTTTPSTGGMGGMQSGAMAHGTGAADTTLVAQLDSVNTAAKAGLTNLPVSVAGPLLESLQTKLAATSNASLRSIAVDLGALRRELGMSTVNGPRIGALLRRIGPKVTRVAAGQHGAVQTTLREIGSELTSAGSQLSAKAAQ